MSFPQAAANAFEGLSTPASRMALAPLLALAVGVVLHLVCDVVEALKPARALCFLGAIVAAAAAELRVLAAPPATALAFDGTFEVDRVTALFGLIFLGAALLAWLSSHGYYRDNRPFKPEHDALILTTPAGMILMAGARDLVVFFVGLELLSLPLYALCAFRRMRQDSVEAGVKYFLLGSFSSALFLYGAALLYAATGTLSLVELGELARGAANPLATPLALSGLALVAASLFFKVAVFPFHLWAPDVYQGSPTPVTALMATGTKAAAFAFLVVQLTPLLPAGGRTTVAVLALATMALGNLGALVQSDLKRMLAYSSVAHAGTLLLIVAAGMGGRDASGAVQAALYYLGGYLFTATGAFGMLALLEADGARFTRLESLRGLSRSRPLLAAVLALFLLSLGGIPATAGFLGKWFVFAMLVRQDMLLVAVLGALLSTVALGYYLRVIVVMYMQEAPAGEEPPRTQRWSAGLVGALCAAFVLAMGLCPWLFLSWPFA